VPTYQYACTSCGHQLEAVQSFADEPLTECPACEGRLRKMFSSVGIVFKGSGFYRTDSRSTPSESGGAESAKESGKASGGDGSAAKKEAGGSSSADSSSSSSSSGGSSSATGSGGSGSSAGSSAGGSSSTSSAPKTPSAA
jgi:putative FmdB family regulatory protein